MSKMVKMGPRTIHIPETWDSVAFHDAIERNPGYEIPDETSFKFLPMDSINEESQTVSYWNERQKDRLTRIRFKDDDTVYAKITPCTENGKIAFIDDLNGNLAFGSTELIVFSPKKDVIIPRFVFYLANLPALRQVTISLMEGSTGRQRVPTDVFDEAIEIPLPPVPEQKKIVAILSRVDEAIRTTEEIIEETEQLKKGLMQDLLTRGIGHDEFKEVQIGPKKLTIPRSWEVEDVENACRINENGFKPDCHQSNIFRYIDIESVSVASIDQARIIETENAPSRARRFVRQGDVLVSTVRPYLKAFAYVDSQFDGCVCSTGFAVLSDNGTLAPEFLRHFVLGKVFVDQMIDRMTGTSYPAVNNTDFKKVKVLVPPPEEQRRIGRALTGIDDKLQTEREYRQKLTELKKGLMQDLLTGKVRVTDLPDEMFEGLD